VKVSASPSRSDAAAAGFIEAQKSFRKIQGIDDLWILRAALKRPEEQTHVDARKRAA
jgi:hypothetical protein